MAATITVDVAAINAQLANSIILGTVMVIGIGILFGVAAYYRRNPRILFAILLASMVLTGIHAAIAAAMRARYLSLLALASIEANEWLAGVAATYGYWVGMFEVMQVMAIGVVIAVALTWVIAALREWNEKRREAMKRGKKNGGGVIKA